MVVRVVHNSTTGAAANPNVLVDGPKWDADHTVTGLENVDNTSDASKPVSTATQASLDTKQPLDADLTAIAALTTATYGRSLLTLANATALAGEVDSFFLTPAEGNAAYQPLDADLTAIAALTGTNTIYYRSAANTWSPVTVGANLAFAGGTLSGASAGAPVAPQGRLTLTTGVAVTTSDVTGATSAYYTFCGGQYVPLYASGAFVNTDIVAELSLALDSNSGHTGYHQSGKIFDFFVVNDSGTIRLGTGPAWTSDTARGTGAATTELDFSKAFPTNKNSMTLRFGSASGNTVSVAANAGTYVGSFRATADGQATDSRAKRFLYNAYNQTFRFMERHETNPANSNTWTQTSSPSGYRRANSSTDNSLFALAGLTGTYMTADVTGVASHSVGSDYASVGIGIASATVNSASRIGFLNYIGTSAQTIGASYEGYPGLGLVEFVWLENAPLAGTATWYGGTNGTTFLAGITGRSLQ